MDQASTQVVEITANLDDASGEVVGAALETLLEDGALDAWTTPIQMKKQRPGVMLSLLCEAADRERLARRIIQLTGTFGVRYRDWQRLVLDRRSQPVVTPFGPIRLKVGWLNGRVMIIKPEFEDVREAARIRNVSVQRVMTAAIAAADAILSKEQGGER